MERRQRLSRSRDFDAVYRQGRSVSTRALTLHWFVREDEGNSVGARMNPGTHADFPARVGLAIPRAVGNAVTRNRLKRQLREAWSTVVEEAPPGRDYVLVARAGLAEAAESRGHDWLLEQLREVLGKVQA